MTLFSGLGTDVHFSGDETGLQRGRLSLRVAERSGVAYDDVERSRRAISDARHECVAQHVQWLDEQSAH